ncbi:MAG: ATP phosphoribosyltransferase regulatory subunit [Actinobacteria bacterium]|nr:ATP phosphoribosyltransferase regulatory subunit [Actinomycetota bacterium]
MIPEGMRDVLPPESGQLRAIETALCRRFEAYGYGEVRTPWLEYAETLETVEDDTLEAGYRLRDQQGHELMARTDMTVPVARLAAARFHDRPLPLRFFYVAPSIRPWAPQRSQDGEFVQAGAELLGLRSAAADAESVILLCDCLAALGLREFRVALGTVAFYTALVDSLGLDDDREKFLEALADRDYPLLESIAGNSGADEDALKVLWRTLELSGTRDGLSQVRKMASSDAMDDAIRHLVEVRDLVEDAGFEDAVTLDFGLYQDLTYYSGVIFEAYAPGVGLPIASGGRYDGLLERFEWDIPGVGFAIALDRLHGALEEAGAVPCAAPACIAFAGGLDEPARAMELRRAGWAVAALPDDAPAPPRPRLHRSGGAYVLELADGSEVSGSWRDVLRALGIA